MKFARYRKPIAIGAGVLCLLFLFAGFGGGQVAIPIAPAPRQTVTVVTMPASLDDLLAKHDLKRARVGDVQE